jgi:DNA-binding NtrC family response regulator
MMVMGDTIDVRDLPEYLWGAGEHAGAGHEGERDVVQLPSAGPASLEEQERRLIVQALETAGGNQSQAARLLRVGRDALRYKLKKHNITTAS